MANRPAKASAKKRVDPSEPGYELVFERSVSGKGAIANLLSELKSLGERSAAALGDAYAVAATSFLKRSERLEDLNAERKFHQRSKTHAAKSSLAK